VVAGALLAIGVVNCGVQNENDPAFALISDYATNSDPGIRAGAILGLGLAYAGTQKEEVQELLVPLVGLRSSFAGVFVCVGKGGGRPWALSRGGGRHDAALSGGGGGCMCC
jgi:hypothetical protein